MKLTPPRGTQDILPPRSERMLALYDAAHRVATSFGYGYVETPTFEGTELFARSSGESSDVVSKEMYEFTDRGGRSVTLRPEGTAPVVRAYLANAHDLATPFRGYYVETLFRYGRPQSGRLREFRSFGVEVLGAEEPEADVEVIEIGHALLGLLAGGEPRLGDVELQLNSIGDETCRPAYRELLIAYLEANAALLRDEHRERFRDNPLRVLDCKDDACRAVSAEAPKIADHLCQPCAGHFAAVRSGLTEAGIDFSLVPTLVRGLDYYTRTAFEFVSSSLGPSQGTIVGGGRYDGLAEVLGGPATPGVGFGAGIERILLALGDDWEPAGAAIVRFRGLGVFVVAVGDGAIPEARALVRELRGPGCSRSVSTLFGDRPVKAQFRTADRLGARFAVILGDREIKDGTFTVRRMRDGEERSGLPRDEMLAWIDDAGGAG
jgi:histidyl-tRNA synthetase